MTAIDRSHKRSLGHALEQGDIIEVDFNPSVGHEPTKSRPAVVVSVYSFNTRSSLVSVVPITSKNHNYPLHVALNTEAVTGWACVEALRNIDLEQRGFRLIGYADDAAMNTIMGLIRGMFGLR